MQKVLLSILFAVSGCLLAFRAVENSASPPDWPGDWPEPMYNFADNPFSEEGFELGRKLFYDPELSRDKTISCATCHLQYTGFAHVDHNVSHGIEGRKGTRNAPALINLIWQSSFHWDGGVNHLDAQAINPITHPAEMDNTLENVLDYLRSSMEYKVLFHDVFGDSSATSRALFHAISLYTTSLISSDSKYDQYMRNEIEFTDQEKKGLQLFRTHCAVCHREPLFQTNGFASNGLSMDSNYRDVGRFAITHQGRDSMHFKIPTLRNIEVTFPYMHDGRFRKLREVLDHYASIRLDQKYLNPELQKRIALSPEDKKDLIAFLYTLTDRKFLYNPRLSFPR
ncbi:MAG: cytochrome-c peroxidase [Bacteroidetes bacterium RIFCSPHIGHO2_02_FULL_44_7]|nr:MAG: cytochrome-c peroxidase [Bacteroidetes bacterium RIFCSPHIGHO2_02_FULL_44_7]